MLSWFLVPDQDDLIVTVAANDDAPGVQLAWHLDPVNPDTVDLVERLLGAGVAGRITLSLTRRRDAATAYFPDGTQSTTARTSWLGRLLHTSSRAMRERRYPPFPLGSGHISLRDVATPPAR